jgi:hypothetical protein
MPPTPLLDVLRSWHDFFLLVGGASATLLGLVFVSLTLVIELPVLPDDHDRRLFATPILVHFAYAIVIAAVCLAPWQRQQSFGVVITLIGAVTLRKSVIIVVELARRHTQTPVSVENWIHIGLAPFAVALVLVAGGVLLIMGDLRGVMAVATGAFTLDVIALFSAWSLFLWLLKEQRRGKAGVGSG